MGTLSWWLRRAKLVSLTAGHRDRRGPSVEAAGRAIAGGAPAAAATLVTRSNVLSPIAWGSETRHAEKYVISLQ